MKLFLPFFLLIVVVHCIFLASKMINFIEPKLHWLIQNRGVHQNANVSEQEDGGFISMSMLTCIFLNGAHLVHELLTIHSFFYISMVCFLLSLSMLRKEPFSASKYAKDMLAYRNGTPYCFMHHTTALHVSAWRFSIS